MERLRSLPWPRAARERRRLGSLWVIGSIRRECLDHVVIFNERQLRRVLPSYVDYYHRTRTHLSLDKDRPDPRPISRPGSEESSPYRKSVACIIVTNASPPDSHRSSELLVACRSARVVLRISVSVGSSSSIRGRPPAD